MEVIIGAGLSGFLFYTVPTRRGNYERKIEMPKYLEFVQERNYVCGEWVRKHFTNKCKMPVVYIMYSYYGEILYIGRTTNFNRRWKEHIKNIPLEYVAKVTVYVHYSLADACFNEIQGITKNKPRWNTTDKNNHPSTNKIDYMCFVIFYVNTTQ